jgi:hypothetical protein
MLLAFAREICADSPPHLVFVFRGLQSAHVHLLEVFPYLPTLVELFF